MGLGLLHPPSHPRPFMGQDQPPRTPPQNNHSKMFPASGAKGETLGEGQGSSLPQPPCQPRPAGAHCQWATAFQGDISVPHVGP